MEAKQAKDVTGSILEEGVREPGQQVPVFCGTIYIATPYSMIQFYLMSALCVYLMTLFFPVKHVLSNWYFD